MPPTDDKAGTVYRTKHPPAPRQRLGEILVAGGAITADQLTHALAEQATRHLPLGQTLLALGYTTDETMRQALSTQLGIPYIDLQLVIIDRSLAPLIDPAFAREHALFPVARIGRTLTVAMDDPTATAVVEALEQRTGHTITVVTSSHDAIHRALARLYEGSAGSRDVVSAPAAPARAPASPVFTGDNRVHAYVELLGLKTPNLPDVLRAIEEGLEWGVLDRLAGESGLPAERVAEIADIGPHALAARRDEGRFSRDESDRLVRTARVVGSVLGLFKGDRATTLVWLTSRQPALKGRTPFDLARTDLGAREVERVLAQFDRVARKQEEEDEDRA